MRLADTKLGLEAVYLEVDLTIQVVFQHIVGDIIASRAGVRVRGGGGHPAGAVNAAAATRQRARTGLWPLDGGGRPRNAG